MEKPEALMMNFKSVKSFFFIALFLPILSLAQSEAEIRASSKHGSDVLTYGMGYEQQRHSPLRQINKKNVKKLTPVWALSLENDFGEQAQPIVVNGRMFVSNAKWTVAIDALTGKQLWRTAVDFDPDTPRVACCGVSNKGVAVYNGLVYRGTLDAHLVALDQETGKEAWRVKVAEWTDGYSINSAPIIANGVLITGIAGADFGARGFLAGYEPQTGKELWRRYMTAAPDEPGGDTWTVKDSYLRGGGSTWLTGSFDPELNLVYWGTGNAAPWNPAYRGGDSLFTASMVAIRPDTGSIVWHYQFTPNDIFDYDAVSEPILTELVIDNVKRRVLIQVNRNGFLYVLDRTNGKVLAAHMYEKVNWASGIDLQTGRPIETEFAKRLRAGELQVLWPSPGGAKNWQHAAYDPVRKRLYVNTLHMWASYRMAPLGEYKPGQRWMGIQDVTLSSEKGQPVGHTRAIDPISGKLIWSIPYERIANWSSILSTASGVLFTGLETGEFIALDADNGKLLWQFRTSSGINSNPIAWSHNGRQYITVLSGIGGIGKRFLGSEGKNIPAGGSVWTFSLP
jgi:alcohol dehydrogenase (cytochrome c)